MEKNKKKTRPVSVRLSEEEFEAIEKKATECGVKRHRFMVDVLRKAGGLPTFSDVVE